jgi:hypothetical protein
VAALITENITINQGAALQYPKFEYLNDDLSARDLTGYTARMHIREFIEDTATVAELTTENGGITIDAVTAEIFLYLSPADTAALTIRQGVYDLEIVPPDGKVVRLAEGKVKVDPEVTR